MRIENRTPCRVMAFDRASADGVARRVFVVKGTFRQSAPQGPLVPVGDAAAGDPIQASDLYSGARRAPHNGAVLDLPHEIAMAKTRAEVLVLGCARSPRGEARESWPVSLAVGGQEKRLVVTGPRSYNWRDGRWRCGRPSAVTEVPLSYALAWGGCWEGASYAANPAGIGWRPTGAPPPGDAPQVVYADEPEPDSSPEAAHRPAGLGALAPWWTPRSSARTPEEAALCAMSDQWHDKLAPGTFVALRGITPGGLVEFCLPDESVTLSVVGVDGIQSVALVLDTVTVLANRGVVTLVWRGTLPAATGPWRARLTFAQEMPRG